MIRVNRLLFLVAVLVSSGCAVVEEKLSREDLVGAAVNFTPEVAVANVDTWWYEFSDIGVLGCNEGDLYQATSWDLQENSDNVIVRVYFGEASEYYVLTADRNSDLESGTFKYYNSYDDEMKGDWTRDFTTPCSSP